MLDHELNVTCALCNVAPELIVCAPVKKTSAAINIAAKITTNLKKKTNGQIITMKMDVFAFQKNFIF